MNRKIEGMHRVQDVSWAAKIGPSPWEPSQKGMGNLDPVTPMVRKEIQSLNEPTLVRTSGLSESMTMQNGKRTRQKVWGGRINQAPDQVQIARVRQMLADPEREEMRRLSQDPMRYVSEKMLEPIVEQAPPTIEELLGILPETKSQLALSGEINPIVGSQTLGEKKA